MEENARGSTCSGCPLTSPFPSEIDTEIVIRVWRATVISSRLQEDRLGGETVPVNFLSDTDSCRTLSDTFPRFCPVTCVPSAKCERRKCGCSGQRRIPVSRSRWNRIHRVDVDTGGYDVRLSDWTFLDAALRGTRSFHFLRATFFFSSNGKYIDYLSLTHATNKKK